MATFRVRIPEPCPMSMNDMEPVQNGYHCAQCEKTVVDFRSYSTDEIQAYFTGKKGQRVCGIISAKNEEELPAVTITGDRMYRGVSRLFFAALFMVFTHLFMGCGGTIEPQEPAEPLVGIMEAPDITRQKDTSVSDTSTLHITPPPIPPIEDKPVVCGEAFLPPDSVELIPDTLAKAGEVKPMEFEALGMMVESSMPEFPGGEVALMKYLQKNVHYPEYEKEEGIQGKVYASFTVAEDGAVEEIKIVRGVEAAPNFNTEVIRVMQGMPNWKPGTLRGKAARMRYNLPIDFRLK